MPIAAVYVRCSTDLQDVANSLDAQERELRDRAARDGWEVGEVYRDAAESGRNEDRPEFQRMIAAAKAKRFGRLYCYDVSRFSRDRLASLTYKTLLRNSGVEIVYLKEHIEDTLQGRLIEGILEVVAAYQSENTAEDVRRGQREITRRGYWHGGRVPYGYTTRRVKDGDEEHTILVPDEERRGVVLEVFRLAAKGEAALRIAESLNARGYRTRSGKTWSRDLLYLLLRNPVYSGRLVYGRQSIRRVGGHHRAVNHPREKWTVKEDACEALVPPDLWEQVQEQIRTRKIGSAHGKREYLLSGLLVCAHCGGALTGSSEPAGKRKAYRYYCRNHLARGNGACPCRRIRAEPLEDAVLAKVREALSDEEIVAAEFAAGSEPERMRSAAERKRLDRELSECERRIANVATALADGDDFPSLRSKLRELEARRRELQGAIAAEEHNAALSQQVSLGVIKDHLIALRDILALPGVTAKRINEALRSLCVVTYNSITKRGSIAYRLPRSRGVRSRRKPMFDGEFGEPRAASSMGKWGRVEVQGAASRACNLHSPVVK